MVSNNLEKPFPHKDIPDELMISLAQNLYYLEGFLHLLLAKNIEIPKKAIELLCGKDEDYTGVFKRVFIKLLENGKYSISSMPEEFTDYLIRMKYDYPHHILDEMLSSILFRTDTTVEDIPENLAFGVWHLYDGWVIIHFLLPCLQLECPTIAQANKFFLSLPKLEPLMRKAAEFSEDHPDAVESFAHYARRFAEKLIEYRIDAQYPLDQDSPQAKVTQLFFLMASKSRKEKAILRSLFVAERLSVPKVLVALPGEPDTRRIVVPKLVIN